MGFTVADDVIIAYERALGLAGVDTWAELSDQARSRMLDDELLLLAAERKGYRRSGKARTAQKDAEEESEV